MKSLGTVQSAATQLIQSVQAPFTHLVVEQQRHGNGDLLQQRIGCVERHSSQFAEKTIVRQMTKRSAAQHSAAQHSTAQHSTAQHSTAQHSTEPLQTVHHL